MRVCFVAENAYPVIAENELAAFGGMETQAWAFAQALHQTGAYSVSFAVCSPEHFCTRIHSGIEVHNRPAFFEHVRRRVAVDCVIQHSWPPIQIKRWRYSLLWQLPLLLVSRPFRRSDAEFRGIRQFYSQLSADTSIAFGVSSLTTTIVEAARDSGKHAVISCASNDDLRSEYCSGSSYVNAYGDTGAVLSRGLNAASQIFVQTELQQQLAKTNLNLQTEILPNPVDPRWLHWATDQEELLGELVHLCPQLSAPFVLWTGRTDRFHKRPEMAFALARRLPHVHFVMVLNVTNVEYFRQLATDCPQNVEILAPVSHPRFIALMSRATAFLSTGSPEYEGFPNVFLQAGVLGVPVVSAACDFGILTSTGIGRAFRDNLEEMCSFLDEIWSNTQMRQSFVEGVRERTLNRYGFNVIGQRLHSLLQGQREQPEPR